MSDPTAEPDLEIHAPKKAAAGVKGVQVALTRAHHHMGVARSVRTLTRLNQADGFDCMSCAWPDPDPEQRHTAEFCENGAKAVAEEGTRQRATSEFFARHSIDELDGHDEYWLGQQGRITQPMVKRPGSAHYEPLTWDDAFGIVAEHLNALASPDEALFYTSGRASNEAAFAYQLFARAFGTNNLPDCSNMCHESTGVALSETIGIGKGSVSLLDIHAAELIVVMGQNPGTNHPRMLSALEAAKKRGARIIAVNPLREAGLINFKNPQRPSGVVGRGTPLADLYLQIRPNGDLVLLQTLAALVLEAGAVDREFVAAHTRGFEEWADRIPAVDWAMVGEVTGLTEEQVRAAADMLIASEATIWCWAMGLTQHRNAVATIKEVVNLALVRGDIGKPGAGLCPVRGHSNVQGDRTMGVWERMPDEFLDALRDEFGFDPPRHHGFDTVDAIRALRDGRASVFVGLGGNFVQASPDTEVTTAAMRNASLTVHISTKLNRSHLVTGRTALILPTKGRTERDVQATGEQYVTVEDSMSAVHASRGRLEPASDDLKSETEIVAGIAHATIGARHGIDWPGLAADYDRIREHIARVVPGCEDYSDRASRPGGFVLPHPPRDSRSFPTGSGYAEFTVSPAEVLQVPPGHLLLQTMRSHDQFNTTIYGLSDRYRGVENGRRVVLVHRDDIAALGFEDGERVDLVGVWNDGIDRVAEDFRIVEYDTPRGSAAAYYPETNPLVPLDDTALHSNTPVSKGVICKLRRRPA